MEKFPKDVVNGQESPHEETLTAEEIEARFPDMSLHRVLLEHPEIGLKLTDDQIAQINAIKNQADYRFES